MAKAILLKKALRRSPLWAKRKWLTHALFWVLVYVILCVLDYRLSGWPMVLLHKGIDVVFYALIIYLNLLYLIPRFLTSKKFWLYVVLLLLLVLLLTPIKAASQLLIFSSNSNLQTYLLENQSYYFLSMFLIASSSTVYSIVSDWLIHQSEKRELQTQTMQSELKFLRSQVNPHFLFNTLNNLYALTLKKSDDAPEIVLKLSEIMRYMLYECNERFVPLKKELTYLQNYLDLERLRQHKEMDISMSIEGMVTDQKIAPLLFIPFVENSFKHGLNNVLTDGFVHIDITVLSDRLEFMITNSKPSQKPRLDGKRSGGIGLVNVKRRLNLIYPDKYHLGIKNEPDKYQVKLILNF